MKQYGDWSFRPVSGFCKPATILDIAKSGYVLTPGRYVGTEEAEDDSEAFAAKYPRLVAELEEHFSQGERLAHIVRQRLSNLKEDA